MVRLKKSKFGFIASFVFSLFAVISFLFAVISVKTNPGNSELSGLWFSFCVYPWAFLIPDSLAYSKIWGMIVYPLMWAIVILNAFIIYCIFGGLRIKK
jgi:hypothetical protein